MAKQALPALRSAARLEAVKSSRLAEPVDHDSELDRLTRTAARILRVPLAAVTVVDREAQSFRSSVGVPEPFAGGVAVPLTHSICKYVVSTGRPLVVPDARHHRWLTNNSAVGELGMVAYAGVPIRFQGEVVGAFCVSDSEPRNWSEEDVRVLADLAGLVEEEVAQRGLRDSVPLGPPPEMARDALENLLAIAARYDALVEQSIVGICIVRDGRFRYVNSRFAEMFGYSLDELLALDSVLDVTAEEDRLRVAENLRRRVEGEVSSLHYQFRGRRRDASPIDVEVHGTRVDMEGQPAIVSVVLDVTARTRAEQALRSSQERLRLIVAGAHDAFVALDEEGTIVEWNAEAERTFGWSRREALGQPVVETILPPRYRRAHTRAIRRLREAGDLSKLRRRMELRALHRDGREFPVELTVTAVPENGGQLLCAFLHDVTHRREVEEALRRNEERFRWLVENSWDMVQVLDGKGMIRYTGPSTERVLGLAEDEILGTAFEEMVHPDDRAAVSGAMRAEDGAADTQPLDIRVRHRNGEWRTVEMRARVLTDPDGEPTTFLNMHDLTARHQARRELERRSAVIELMRGVAVASNEAETAREAVERALRLVCHYSGWPLARAVLVGVHGTRQPDEIWHHSEEVDTRSLRRAVERGSIAGRDLVAEVITSRESARTPREAETPVIQSGAPEGKRSERPSQLVRKASTGPASYAVPILTVSGLAAVLEFHHAVTAGPDSSLIALTADVAAQLGRVFEREEAAEALRTSDERLQLVSRATNDAIWEWDVRAGTLTWSEIAPRVLRYRSDEMGDSIDWWYERIHASDRERVVSALHAVMAGTDNTWSGEYRFQRGDGQHATVLDRVWVVRDDRDAPTRVIGCMLDVSERRQAEEAQRLLGQATGMLASSLEPEESLSRMAQLLVPGFCDHCFVDLVEGERLRRVAVAHVEPPRDSALTALGDRELAAEPRNGVIARALRTAEPILITEWSPGVPRQVRAPRQERWIEMLGTTSLMVVPLVSFEGTLGVLVLATSRSRRQYGPRELLLGEELARRCTLALENSRLYRQAREAVRAREEILGVVTHDLRNPLHTVQLATGMLHDANRERRADNVRWLEIIDRSVDEMEHMIEDLLDLSSIDAGRLSINPAAHEVAEVVKLVCDTFEPLATRDNVAIRCSIEPEIRTVWVDAHRIHRVFSNLIGNALKFTPEGGMIRLEAALQDDQVRFTVADSGPGIPAAELSRVFDRYWQARRGDRRGAGLGLAIARGIVEQHHGHIWVESPPGEGAAFHFTLPVAGEVVA